jgi:hypothetical protein
LTWHEIFTIALRQIESSRMTVRPWVLLGDLVKHVQGIVAIVDDLKLVGKFMRIEHPPDKVDVHRVIVHDKDGQWRTRCCLHVWLSSGCPG